MRHWVIAIFLCLAFCASRESQTQTQENSGPISTVKAFLVALQNADLDGVVATFAADATVFMPMPTIPKRLSGKKEILEGFSPLLKEVRESGNGPPYMVLNPQDIESQEFETMAIVTFHLGKLLAEGSTEATSFSRRTFILRPIHGEWFIVHMHASNVMIQPKSKS